MSDPTLQMLIIIPIIMCCLIALHLFINWFHWNNGICIAYNEPWRLERVTAGSDVIFKCRDYNLRISWMIRKFIIKKHQVEYGDLYWKSKHNRGDIERHINSLTSL